MERVTESKPLQILLLPYFSPSHMIPLCEMGHSFASRGHHVTVITTPSNAALVRSPSGAGRRVSTHLVHLPFNQVGLPENVENLLDANDVHTAGKLFHAVALLQNEIEDFIRASPPDCIITDPFYPWTADTAARLGIPRLVFLITCTFTTSLMESVRTILSSPDHHDHLSDYDPFPIPGLPGPPISMCWAQLPDYVRDPTHGYLQLKEKIREAELKSYGAVVNNFYEMEPAYAEHYQRIMGHRVFHLGPTSLMASDDDGRTQNERSNYHEPAVGKHECLQWLDSKKPDSVIYVSFGSMGVFGDAQLMEIACALEMSGHDFIWKVRGKDGDGGNEWLPPGYEERIAGRGMVVKGWAPQLLILDHPAVGGFMSHCGWNSVIESVSGGVPMVTWPLFSEQFYQEKLLTDVLGMGVSVGNRDWYPQYGDVDKRKVIDREAIVRAVTALMNGENESAMEMRRKAKELQAQAKSAVKEGGSSQAALTKLIEELQQLRNNRNLE